MVRSRVLAIMHSLTLRTTKTYTTVVKILLLVSFASSLNPAFYSRCVETCELQYIYVSI